MIRTPLFMLAILLLAAVAQASDYRILALRVQFQPDDLETTFGTGEMNSSFEDYAYPFDRTPHDADYFSDHLTHLDQYYRRVSGDRITISHEVFPTEPDSVYQLPYPMWHYHYNDPDLADRQLAELFRDVLLLAGTDEQIDFQPGDIVFIFHAGTGQDFGSDSTPFDIPSAWIGPADLAYLDTEYTAGIPVWNGVMIQRGAILPEAEHQEGYAHGLFGTLVLQFGHAMGLPGLYNTETGQTAIGKWGLMDQGSANFRGLMPAWPSAWTRYQFGWVDAVTITQSAVDLPLRTVGTQVDAPELYRIPINNHEYYLVEARIRDRNGDSLSHAEDRDGRRVVFHEDYTVSFPGDTAGVIIQADDQDYDIPGSGILIWHIDETRTTAAAIQENRVNADPDRRGVDLEEADGVQDMGWNYSLFSARRWAMLGNFYDAWSDTNSHFLHVNDHLDAVEFSRWSEPPTRSRDGDLTHIRFYNFSHPDTLMTFSVSFDEVLPGYPLTPTVSLQSETGRFLDEGVFLCLTDEGTLYAHSPDSVQFYPDNSGGFASALPQDLLTEPLIHFAVMDDQLALATATTLIIGTREISSGVWSFSVDTTVTLNQPPDRLLGVAGNWYLTADQQFYSLVDGALQEEVAGGPVIGLREFDGLPLVLVEQEGALAGSVIQPEVRFDWPVRLVDAVGTTFDHTSWLLLAAENQLRAYDAEGELLWTDDEVPGTVLELAVADSDADGRPEWLVLTDMQLRVYQLTGLLVGRENLDNAHSLRVWTDTDQMHQIHWLQEDSHHAVTLDPVLRELDGYPRTLTGQVNQLLISPAGYRCLVGNETISFSTQTSGEGVHWGADGGDARQGGFLADGSPFPLQTVTAVDELSVFSWPNPSQNSMPVHIVYRPRAAADVTIDIYDRTGRLVESAHDQVTGQGGGEYLWQVDNVPSGIYYGRVQLDFGQGNDDSVLIKMAVIQ